MKLIKPADKDLHPTLLKLVKDSVDPLLEKHGLKGHVARVGLVLDFSGSMCDLYQSGKIQALVNRFVALGHRFDDDGAIDLFAYSDRATYVGELHAGDFEGIEARIHKSGLSMGGTSYSTGIQKFRTHAFGNGLPRKTPLAQKQVPYYLGFITDGQNSMFDHGTCVEQFRSASFEPVFVQCIALGEDYDSRPQAVQGNEKPKGWLKRLFSSTSENDRVPSQFEFLAELDSHVDGRLVDNTNFFATVSPNALSDDEFFGRMMGEYPNWLTLARAEGLVK